MAFRNAILCTCMCRKPGMYLFFVFKKNKRLIAIDYLLFKKFFLEA